MFLAPGCKRVSAVFYIQAHVAKTGTAGFGLFQPLDSHNKIKLI